MLLDINAGTTLVALPLIMIGLCLFLYGKEILDVLSFPIGAISGGVLAYMMLRGFLAPYEIPLYIEIVVAGGLVFLGGLMGQGTMVMAVAILITLATVDAINVFLGEGNEVLAWIIGAFMFAIILYPAQKFIHFSSAAVGGVLIAMSIFIVFDGLDPIVRTGAQVAIIVVACVAGGLFQKWLEKRIRMSQEEITWIPTIPAS